MRLGCGRQDSPSAVSTTDRPHPLEHMGPKPLASLAGCTEDRTQEMLKWMGFGTIDIPVRPAEGT